MSWVTFIWALVIGACATMALPHLLVGLTRQAWENLFFVLAALSVAGIAWRAGDHAFGKHREIGRTLQWTHVPIFFISWGSSDSFTSISGPDGSGWEWPSVRCALDLVINFAFPPNVNFREITSLRRFDFLGDTISMPGECWARALLGVLSSFLMLAYVIDASLRLWRRGGAEGRRRALIVGGSMTYLSARGGIVRVDQRPVLNYPT